jgi:cephalosporin-C deacetylase
MPTPTEQSLAHGYPFDPSYGYDLQGLFAIEPPPVPDGFAEVWRERYRAALAVDPSPRLARSRDQNAGYHCLDIAYRSTDDFHIGGWMLIPKRRAPTHALICGHGYGGVASPDFELPCADAIYLIPCFRGLGRSARAPISSDPWWHVLHDIDKPDRYILRGCVEDLWTGVSALLLLYPWLQNRIGYMGISFGGGIGALALPWEPRIALGHLNVPTFGHYPLRLGLRSIGSSESVRQFVERNAHTAVTLSEYDAAVAARFIRQPMHLALALFDPVVPPPGQFAIYNAIHGNKQLMVMRAGHFDYPEQTQDEQRLIAELGAFFAPLGD